MNWKAVPRKPRKHPAILRDAPLFEDAFHNGRYDEAARIVIGTALEVLGVEGLMYSLDDANSFLKRLKYRRGL